MDNISKFTEPTYYAHAGQIQTFRAKNNEYAGYGGFEYDYGKGLLEGKHPSFIKKDNGYGRGTACTTFRDI